MGGRFQFKSQNLEVDIFDDEDTQRRNGHLVYIEFVYKYIYIYIYVNEILIKCWIYKFLLVILVMR